MALREGVQAPELAGQEALYELAAHKLAPILSASLSSSGELNSWPLEFKQVLQANAAARAVVAELADLEVRHAFRRFEAAGVRAVLIKGAALAYTHYPAPALRPRGDTDLVVERENVDAVATVLRDLGYEPAGGVDGSLVTGQAQWSRALTPDVEHSFDVHWQPFNPHAFAGVLTARELLQAAVAVERLGPGARAPHPAHALLLACAHRAAHHAGSEDLLWAYDIHLIAGSLTSEQAAQFVALARQRGVVAVCANGLEWARRSFETRLPAALSSLLDQTPAREEPTAAFLRPGRRQVDVLASDLRAVRGWRRRFRLLGQHLFPRGAYMEQRYGVRGWFRVAPLYLTRILRGVPRWFRRS